MYTIKKFQHGEVIESAKEVKRGITWITGIKSRGITWVVMLDNEPVFALNRLTDKKELVGYSRKSTAQKEADYFNQKGDARNYIGAAS